MPLFVWMMLVVSGMILVVLPPLTAARIMLLLDRYLGANFFNTQAGGSAVLWQHFFWTFVHPEVYVLMIPGFACVSEIIPVFSRKPIFGYALMVAALVTIGFISMSVWAHQPQRSQGTPACLDLYCAGKAGRLAVGSCGRMKFRINQGGSYDRSS